MRILESHSGQALSLSNVSKPRDLLEGRGWDKMGSNRFNGRQLSFEQDTLEVPGTYRLRSLLVTWS